MKRSISSVGASSSKLDEPRGLDRLAALDTVATAARVNSAGHAEAVHLLSALTPQQLGLFLQNAFCFAAPTDVPPLAARDELCPFPSEHSCCWAALCFVNLARFGSRSQLASADKLLPLYIALETNHVVSDDGQIETVELVSEQKLFAREWKSCKPLRAAFDLLQPAAVAVSSGLQNKMARKITQHWSWASFWLNFELQHMFEVWSAAGDWIDNVVRPQSDEFPIGSSFDAVQALMSAPVSNFEESVRAQLAGRRRGQTLPLVYGVAIAYRNYQDKCSEPFGLFLGFVCVNDLVFLVDLSLRRVHQSMQQAIAAQEWPEEPHNLCFFAAHKDSV